MSRIPLLGNICNDYLDRRCRLAENSGGGLHGRRARHLLRMALLAAWLTGCATPTQRLDEQAHRLGLVRQILPGTEYSHVTYHHYSEAGQGLLHVYLDGDGTPWLTPFAIAADPTPRNPLVLRLLAQDDAPSLYLGRPCYHGQAQAPACHPLLWTSQRYGPQVVDSLAAALQKVLDGAGYAGLVFIGYSGGGTLAMLLAERFPQTRAVLTIAGNLDPPRWAARHGYSPLDGSLNPAARPPLNPAIVQLHLVGGRDKNVPAELVRDVVLQQPPATLVVIDHFDHSCCWDTVWLDILGRLQRMLSGNGGGRRLGLGSRTSDWGLYRGVMQ